MDNISKNIEEINKNTQEYWSKFISGGGWPMDYQSMLEAWNPFINVVRSTMDMSLNAWSQMLEGSMTMMTQSMENPEAAKKETGPQSQEKAPAPDVTKQPSPQADLPREVLQAVVTGVEHPMRPELKPIIK